jgi:tRNA dimethylallyltransferase
MKPRILVIAGPTASGKSDLALELAEQLGGEIVCADSLTVYRGLDIGSAKPTPEQQRRVPHHLLDIREPTQPFTAADFRNEAGPVIADIIKRGKHPLVVGGTGLYLRVLLHGLTEAPGEHPALRRQLRQRAVLEGPETLLEELRQVDPETAARCHPNNLVRIMRALEVWHSTGSPLSDFHRRHGFHDDPYDALLLCLDLAREELYRRIDRRVESMLSAGLVDEVRGLLQAGLSADAKPLQAIGYKEVLAHLRNELPLEAMTELIKRNTRHLAKRQLTWFRREADVQWVAYPQNSATIAAFVAMFFKEGERPHVQDPLQHPRPVPKPVPQGAGQGGRAHDVR